MIVKMSEFLVLLDFLLLIKDSQIISKPQSCRKSLSYRPQSHSEREKKHRKDIIV